MVKDPLVALTALCLSALCLSALCLIASNDAHAQGETAAVTTAANCPEVTTGKKYSDYAQIITRYQNVAKGRRRNQATPADNRVTRQEMYNILQHMMRRKGGSNPWTDREWIDVIHANEHRLAAFEGTTGLVGMMWLAAARHMLDGNDIPPDAHLDLIPRGKIDENGAAPHGELGFQYNPVAKSGHIWNTMCFLILDRNGNETKFLYKVKAIVRPCGFVELDKTGPSQDAFPGSYLTFARNRVTGFDKKLEAVGFRPGSDPTSGCDANTTAAEQQAIADEGYIGIDTIYLDTTGSGTWTLVNRADQPHLFETGAESCVDMFFPTTVPITLDPNDDPGYCLGRCDDPAIINTGM